MYVLMFFVGKPCRSKLARLIPFHYSFEAEEFAASLLLIMIFLIVSIFQWWIK